jgi:hypothetical protein
MLYFMQAGNKIKIGKGMVASRLQTANTWSSEKVQLVLAIHVWDETKAERQLHHHFRQHRLNGEWFEINFPTAFQALLDLKLVPDVPQPALELPVVPQIHPEFRRWYLGVDRRTMGNPFAPSPAELNNDHDHVRYVDENLEDLWTKNFHQFEQSRKKHGGDIDAMIAATQIATAEEESDFWASMRAMLKSSD